MAKVDGEAEKEAMSLDILLEQKEREKQVIQKGLLLKANAEINVSVACYIKPFEMEIGRQQQRQQLLGQQFGRSNPCLLSSCACKALLFVSSCACRYANYVFIMNPLKRQIG